jgi:hypothetical protein
MRKHELNCTDTQWAAWKGASERAGYPSIAAWVRDRLDEAAAGVTDTPFGKGRPLVEVLAPELDADPYEKILFPPADDSNLSEPAPDHERPWMPDPPAPAVAGGQTCPRESEHWQLRAGGRCDVCGFTA